MESLTLEVNGQQIMLSKSPDGKQGGVIFEGKIPQDILSAAGDAVLAFKVSRTAPIGDSGTGLLALARRLIRPVYRRLKHRVSYEGERQGGLLYNWLEIQPSK